MSATPLAVWPAAGARRTRDGPLPLCQPCRASSQNATSRRACRCLQRRLRGAPQHMQRLRARRRNDWFSCVPLPGVIEVQSRANGLTRCTRGVWAAGCEGVRKLYGVLRSDMARPGDTHGGYGRSMAGRLVRARANAGRPIALVLVRRRVRLRAAARGRLRGGLGGATGLSAGGIAALGAARWSTYDVRAALDGGLPGPLDAARARALAGLDGGPSVLPGGDAVGMALSYAMLRRWGFTVEQVTVAPPRRQSGTPSPT